MSVHEAAMREYQATYMNALPFVKWDRCVVGDGWTVAYGWIARSDGQRDFVVLTFDARGVSSTTSSAKYSKEIGLLL